MAHAYALPAPFREVRRIGWAPRVAGDLPRCERNGGAGRGCTPFVLLGRVMLLSREHPRQIRFRSAEPVLTPMLPLERSGAVANVVFRTGVDRRDDLGSSDRF